MKKRAGKKTHHLACLIPLLAVVFAATLSGCKKSQSVPPPYEETYSTVEQVGQVPDSFKDIIEKNRFYNVYAFGDRLLSTYIPVRDSDQNVHHTVRMMDLYGNVLAEHECSSDWAYYFSTLTTTSDGGFIFALGFSDYEIEQDHWASDGSFASRVIKCDGKGNLQFDVSFDHIEGRAFQYCIERNDGFYFFGTRETPETQRRGVVSPSDIYMTKLDHYGNVMNTKTIGGSSFDSLNAAESLGNDFKLSISAQSQDGDFAESNSIYSVDWVVVVNEDFEIIEKSMKSGRDYFDNKIGEKDGRPIYKSDSLLKDFDAGRPTAYIDYGDFYLIVSQNITGIYEQTPLTSGALWYYSETVYSAYDNSGKLLFRASVDSSPDYESLVPAYTITPTDSDSTE